MDNRPIGVFDSGLGGLNVLKEIKRVLPDEKFIYLGDTKRFPYGQKSKGSIIDIAIQNVEFLIEEDVKCIIIACGTVTSQALDVLQEKFEVPIYGIIEPTVLDLKDRIKEKTKIGIIATKGTINSNAWAKHLEESIPDVTTVSKAAPLLATMAEEGWLSNKVAEYTVKEYMSLFEGVDKLILGCTHYPMFKELMENELPDNVEVIDTGVMVAKFLKKELKDKDMLTDEKESMLIIYLTDIEQSFIDSAKRILGEETTIDEIDKFEV